MTRRYLLLEFHYSSAEDRRTVALSLTEKELIHVIRDAVIRLHGDYGLACVMYRLAGRSLPRLSLYDRFQVVKLLVQRSKEQEL